MTKQHLIPNISTNGLIAKDEKMLRGLLAEVDTVLEVPHMLGQREAALGELLQKKLKSRVDPDEPSKLAEEAQKWLDLYGKSIASAREGIRRREREEEEFRAAQRAKREAHSIDIQKRIEAFEAKRREQAERWRKENKYDVSAK